MFGRHEAAERFSPLIPPLTKGRVLPIFEENKKGGYEMAFGIMLNESDLREMPSDLRDNLLKWYFNRDASAVGSPPYADSAPTAAPVTVSAVPRREESGRISFPEFVRAGLLVPGDGLVCRALKRQRRGGSEGFIEAGKVLADGSVEYRGRRYEVPSKLAVDAVNTNGGNTEALNGYDYLFVRSSKGLVPLHALRDRFLKHGSA
jgi:hypothetical protein